MKILALIQDTLREIYARKVVLGIVIIEILTLAITAIAVYSDGMQAQYRDAAIARTTSAEDTTGNGVYKEETQRTREDSLLLGLGEAATEQWHIDSSTERIDVEPGTTTDNVADDMMGEADIQGGAVPDDGYPGTNMLLLEIVKGQMGVFAGFIGLAVIFLGIFATAGIIPSMTEKGTIDLLLSKPISRTTLLFGRATGGILALLVNLIAFNVALYALYGMATGVWHLPFVIWATVLPFFAFLVVYSAVMFLNVLTDSWVLPMSIAYVHIMIFSPLLSSRESSLYPFISSKFVRGIIDGLHLALPQTSDVLTKVPDVIFSSSLGTPWPFVQGGVFAGCMLAAAAWKFSRKDY